MKLRSIPLILAVWMSSLLVGCGVTMTPAQPPPAPPGVVVTFRVADAEQYRIRLVDPDDIAFAQKLMAG